MFTNNKRRLMFTHNKRRLMFTHNKQAWANSILVGCMEKLSGCGPYMCTSYHIDLRSIRGLAYQACWGSEPWAQDEAEYFFQPCNCASHERMQMQASVLHRLWFSTSHADKSPCPVHSLRLTSPLMIICLVIYTIENTVMSPHILCLCYLI